MRVSFDVGGLETLAADIAAAPVAFAKAARGVVEETAIDMRDAWRENAVETSGAHGKHYPKSITYRMRGLTSIGADIYPDPGKPQGGMSFENGSRNQPPHLGGQRALDDNAPRLGRRLDGIAFL